MHARPSRWVKKLSKCGWKNVKFASKMHSRTIHARPSPSMKSDSKYEGKPCKMRSKDIRFASKIHSWKIHARPSSIKSHRRKVHNTSFWGNVKHPKKIHAPLSRAMDQNPAKMVEQIGPCLQKWVEKIDVLQAFSDREFQKAFFQASLVRLLACLLAKSIVDLVCKVIEGCCSHVALYLRLFWSLKLTLRAFPGARPGTSRMDRAVTEDDAGEHRLYGMSPEFPGGSPPVITVWEGP